MIPVREDCEWLVGVVRLHLVTTSEYGRRATKYVDSESVVIIHDSNYTIGDNMDAEPDSCVALMDAVADAICQTGYRPRRIRVSVTRHEHWLGAMAFLRPVEIVLDPKLDLDALVEDDPPWRFQETPQSAHILARLHSCAAALRRASKSCGARGDVDFAFDLPTLGIAGSGCLTRDELGLEGLRLGPFEVDSGRLARAFPQFPADLGGMLLHETIELLHVKPEDASPLLRQERAAFVVDDDPYPFVECDQNSSPVHDASEREVRIACLVAQGLAAFLDANGDQLRTPRGLRGEYDVVWGDEVFTARIARPRRKRSFNRIT